MSGKPEKSPLARLVMFMVCVSIAGGIVAGTYAYVAGQQQPATPSNVCNYMMDYDCHMYGCDYCDRSQAECEACVDDCKKWSFPDCYGSI